MNVQVVFMTVLVSQSRRRSPNKELQEAETEGEKEITSVWYHDTHKLDSPKYSILYQQLSQDLKFASDPGGDYHENVQNTCLDFFQIFNFLNFFFF